MKTYRSTLGLEPSYIKEVEDQKIRVASFTVGGSSIGLFEPTDPTSTVAAFLAKRGEGIHHLHSRLMTYAPLFTQHRALESP